MKIWQCKIGESSAVPRGADGPMREAVARAYKELTGEDPVFIFSGWGAELSEPERAVVENRLPTQPADEQAITLNRAMVENQGLTAQQDAGVPVLAAAMALLVAGEFVTKEKVDEAIQIARDAPDSDLAANDSPARQDADKADDFKEAVDGLGNQHSDEMGNIPVDAWHDFARALLKRVQPASEDARHRMAQAISDFMAEHAYDDEPCSCRLDWCDSDSVDALVDAIYAAIEQER